MTDHDKEVTINCNGATIQATMREVFIAKYAANEARREFENELASHVRSCPMRGRTFMGFVAVFGAIGGAAFLGAKGVYTWLTSK